MTIRKLFSSQLLLSLRNVGWMFVDKIFRMGTSLLVGIWLARYLGPDQYGLLNYAYVFPLILSALVSLGMNTLLGSEIPVSPSPEQTDRLLLTSITLKSLAGFFAFGTISTVNYYLHQHSPLLLRLVSISAATLLFQGFDAVDIYFQSVRKVHLSIIPKIVAFGLASLARVYGLTKGFGLPFFVTVTVIELAVSYLSVYIIYFFHRRIPFFRWPFDAAVARRLLTLAWPIMLAEFFIFIYMRLDQLMIKHLADSSELGKYSAALRISEAWYFVAIALTASFYPAIIALRSVDYTAYLRQYQSLFNTLAIIGIGIGTVFSILAEPIAHLLYGSQYTGVGPILSIHIWTGTFIFMGIGSNNWFVTEGLQKILLWRTIAGAVLNALLNVILIPKYGAMGASFATLFAQFCATYLTNGLYHKTREVFLLQTNALFLMPRYIVSAFRQMMIRLKLH